VSGALRIAPWRGDASTAYLTPARGRPSPTSIARCLEQLDRGDFRTVLTAALAAPEQAPFLAAGFAVRERLHLLTRPVGDLPEVSYRGAVLRRGRHAHRSGVLAVDAAAFPSFWRLDASGLDDALAATPSSRLRVALDADGGVVGYAVTGRAATRGYLQRLAVLPDQHGQGIGSALVVDGLRWLGRWGARDVLVNTQEGNQAAVRLYQRLGFRLQPEGLAVLQRALGAG
jgi:ribosomal protein S18 acetylase RimI-like enzyme